MADDSPSPRVALVTGASRGIGAAIAEALAADGRHVVLVARSEDRLAAVRDRITGAGGAASVEPCDVGDQEAVEAVIERTYDTHDRLDILVNNAGITRDNLLLRMSDEEFDETIRLNLRAAFVATRAVIRPMMRGKWGRIINISSVAGLIGNAGQANYAATKAGLVGMTKSIAREVAGKKITANAVAPGFIETDMTESLPDPVKEGAKKATAMGRFGQPEDIAAAVAFLASEGAGYITGQVLAVDGGMTMC